jgi:acetyl esterase/lipase
VDWQWLNSKGIATFVLKYRLPVSASVIVPNEAPLQDAMRAMRLVRHNCKEWDVERNKIGVIGFSAGGHLASTLGNHFNDPNSFETDAIDTITARPNFMTLIYPVITMREPHTHQGSRENLLGKSPGQNLIDFYSNELQIKSNTPPLLLCTQVTMMRFRLRIVFYSIKL